MRPSRERGESKEEAAARLGRLLFNPDDVDVIKYQFHDVGQHSRMLISGKRNNHV
jgi:hypothetical protein